MLGDYSAAASLPTVPSTFAYIAAGRNVETAFSEVVPGARYTALIAAPAEVEHLTVFLLPGTVFPADKGITVMCSVSPFSEWSTLGVLTPLRPSATFRTGWASRHVGQPALMLGLAIEALGDVASVGSALSAAEWDKLGWAELVARDLCTYLASYAQPTPGGERVVLPLNAIDAWSRRFSERFRHDPNFLLPKAGM